MTVTAESIEFRARFGLGRFVGPWTAAVGEVREIGAGKGTWLRGVEIHGHDGRLLVFFGTRKPQAFLLARFREHGYPLREAPRST